LVSAIIAQNYDADGIIWPNEVTPYKVIVLPLDVTDRKIMGLATDMHEELGRAGVTALLDDRDERAGVKFKDADLLGILLQVIIGKESLKNDAIELKVRRGGKKIIKSKPEIIEEIKRLVNG
jgi:prolyl-tRNA synthetase